MPCCWWLGAGDCHLGWWHVSVSAMRPPSASEVERIIGEITCRLQAYQARKVVLFGSYARGDYTAASDIDLIVVKETDRPFLERIVEVLDVCELPGSPVVIDPLVYTPAEFSKMVADGNPLIKRAMQEGRVLVES